MSVKWTGPCLSFVTFPWLQQWARKLSESKVTGMYVNATAGNLWQWFSSVSSRLPFPAVLVSPVDTGAGEPGVQYCWFHPKGHMDNQVIDFSYFNNTSNCCFLSFPRSEIKLRLACLPVLFFLRHFTGTSPSHSGRGGGTRTLPQIVFFGTRLFRLDCIYLCFIWWQFS